MAVRARQKAVVGQLERMTASTNGGTGLGFSNVIESARIFCSEFSRSAGEPLLGTGNPIAVWLLIEYRFKWEREARSVLPQSLQQHLAVFQSTGLKMRVALIRQPKRNSGPMMCFVAIGDETAPLLYQREFTELEELCGLDLPALCRSSSEVPTGRCNRKLYAVCTHGTHDRCCAKHGSAVYAALNQIRGDDVWQVSHIGGCRFAPNVVCLPHGLVYGRVAKEECGGLVEAYEGERLDLRNLRGRSCYEKPVQAAEWFLRTERGITQLDALRVTSAEEVSPDRWCVRFQARPGSAWYEVFLKAVDEGVQTYKACAAAVPLPREEFRLVECRGGGGPAGADPPLQFE